MNDMTQKKNNQIRTVCCLVFTCCLFPLAAQQAQLSSRQIEAWVTLPDRSVLFGQQAEKINFTFGQASRGGGIPIVIDEQQPKQSIDGFGYALTGGSAENMMYMSAVERSKLIRNIFATDGDNIGVSYIRLSIGASDLNSFVFSYNDLPEGETDFQLAKFDLGQDKKDVIPVMKEILKIDLSNCAYLQFNDRVKRRLKLGFLNFFTTTVYN